ncbi:caspase-1 [Drosophila grimshawi]|uniref:GH21208 n=1 Tax=Drosophila grimshawi TaxID=7222 RepID=B4J750_DROGR|nr:caspase-1 [Drosophila grimshawi]EDW01038.1 GH21208 [Drosophila grimshawi]
MTDECIIRTFSAVGNGGGHNNNADTIDAKGESSVGSTAAEEGGGAAVVAMNVNKYVARMPTERNAREYNMNHKKRGIAVIFNHKSFDIPSLSVRNGTNLDCEELRKAFENLEFEVSVHNDCKFRDILKHTEKASEMDHSDNDCIAIAILSHGEHGYLYARDVQYKLDNIWHYFTAQICPSLAGKPKLFFIQACQGDRFDGGIILEKCVTETDGASSMSYRIPVHADFLFSYSTIPGHYSWRNPEQGSWYIQSLIKELNANGKKDNILDLLTFVSQRVAIDFESNVPMRPIQDRQKQIPCLTSMLTRILRFNDKLPTKN